MQTFKELTILLFSLSILFFIILKINRPPKLKGNRKIADKKVLFRIIILFSLISGIKIRYEPTERKLHIIMQTKFLNFL
jgi:hypothetical protein